MKFWTRCKRLAGWICLLLGLCLLAAGFAQGQETLLFTHATRICLECIGIG